MPGAARRVPRSSARGAHGSATSTLRKCRQPRPRGKGCKSNKPMQSGTPAPPQVPRGSAEPPAGVRCRGRSGIAPRSPWAPHAPHLPSPPAALPSPPAPYAATLPLRNSGGGGVELGEAALPSPSLQQRAVGVRRRGALSARRCSGSPARIPPRDDPRPPGSCRCCF